MLTLYGNGRSRWVKPYWTLKELGVPFEAKTIRPTRIQQDHRDFLEINPYGKIPALKDGDFILYESAAICSYLADKFPEGGLIPLAGTKERARYDQWISFIISELEQPIWTITKQKYVYSEDKKFPPIVEIAKEEFFRVTAILEKEIVENLVGNRFSVADIAMAYTLKWASGFDLLGNNPNLSDYLKLHTSRPAFPTELYK